MNNDAEQRPRTRGECVGGPRPCPWVSCRHHLALEITADGVRLMLPEDPDDWHGLETCSLDVADRGGFGQTDLAALLDGTEYTYRRVRLAEDRGLARMRKARWHRE